MDQKLIIQSIQSIQSLMVEEQRKDRITVKKITSTLFTAALSLAFVNESGQSTGSNEQKAGYLS